MKSSNITTQQILIAENEYWSKGYTVLKGIFSPEDVASWRKECQRLWTLPGLLDDLNLRSEFRRNTSGTCIVDRLDPVVDISPMLLDAVLDARLLDPLEKILRGPLSLLKCKLIRKSPNTGGYAQHQDFLYWRWLDMSADSLCSVGITLYPSNEESGGIEFFPGYHKALLPSADGNPNADFNIEQIDVSTGETPELEPGDALIFHALTPHRSGPNLSSHPRTLLLPSYAVTQQVDLYAKYYMREVARRCNEFVGFENYEMALKAVSDRHVARLGPRKQWNLKPR
ncbi:phytanoyl-CoA dioxygenase family protein [Paraherbaspirillum soli]|uniref:Phytanoyl-CoA dioxygenase family protein n=1 Tax=Paraherbaspirillum soli TaxID=631222 RepID=A0ABW0MDC7_9BURK